MLAVWTSQLHIKPYCNFRRNSLVEHSFFLGVSRTHCSRPHGKTTTQVSTPSCLLTLRLNLVNSIFQSRKRSLSRWYFVTSNIPHCLQPCHPSSPTTSILWIQLTHHPNKQLSQTNTECLHLCILGSSWLGGGTWMVSCESHVGQLWRLSHTEVPQR